MQFSLAVMAGLVIGAVLLAVVRRVARSRPSVPGRVGLGLAITATLVLVAAVFPGRPSIDALMPASIALPVAAVVVTAGSLLRGQRRWIDWVGFVLSLAPALFWVVFVVAEVVGPPH